MAVYVTRNLAAAGFVAMALLACASLGPTAELSPDLERSFHAGEVRSAQDHVAASRQHGEEAMRLWSQANFLWRTGRQCARKWRHERHDHYRSTACSRDFEAQFRELKAQARAEEARSRRHKVLARQVQNP